MPYIVIKKLPTPNLPDDELPAHLRRRHWPLVFRRAVATLEESRLQIADSLRQSDALLGRPHQRVKFVEDALALPESGGTVGPLPDGTLISVERQPDDFDVAVFNAREATGGR
jgi:hypothetical protein